MTSNNHYQTSWEIYKAESKNFADDLSYYTNLCQDMITLELFAGYGRLSNQLKTITQSLECVELDPHLAGHIQLPNKNIHICDVLDFNPQQQFDRIIAGYNSFCLLTQDTQVKHFFTLIKKWLKPAGIISLSYYNHHQWDNCPSDTFMFKGMEIQYTPQCDLSDMAKGHAVWIDTYRNEAQDFYLRHEYPLKLCTREKLQDYLKLSGLKLIDEIYDYGKQDLNDSGWLEYVIAHNN